MTATELSAIKADFSALQSRLDKLIAAKPETARPPLPDMSEKPGYAFLIEGGKEAWREVNPGEQFAAAPNAVGKNVGHGPLVGNWYILTYTPPPDVPANERWWDEKERKWWTVDMVYRRRVADLRPPSGMEFAGSFRPIQKGEHGLGVTGESYSHSDGVTGPRLILRPKPQPRELHLIEWDGQRTDASRLVTVDGVRYKLAEAK